jgi:hypothetical protein
MFNLSFIDIKCFFGFHDNKMTTRSVSIDGTLKEYFRCKNCGRKYKHVSKPHVNHYESNDGTC